MPPFPVCWLWFLSQGQTSASHGLWGVGWQGTELTGPALPWCSSPVSPHASSLSPESCFLFILDPMNQSICTLPFLLRSSAAGMWFSLLSPSLELNSFSYICQGYRNWEPPTFYIHENKIANLSSTRCYMPGTVCRAFNILTHFLFITILSPFYGRRNWDQRAK